MPNTTRVRLTRAIFSHYIGILADAQRYTPSGAMLDEYFLLLSMWLWQDQYVAAMRSYEIGTRPFWPLPGQIMERAGVTAIDAPTAFARIRGTIVREGLATFTTRDAPLLAPIVAHALTKAGGAEAVADAETVAPRPGAVHPIVALTARFREVFELTAARTPKDLALPGPRPTVEPRTERTGGGLTRAIDGGR